MKEHSKYNLPERTNKADAAAKDKEKHKARTCLVNNNPAGGTRAQQGKTEQQRKQDTKHWN
jgi:hypothetical protein